MSYRTQQIPLGDGAYRLEFGPKSVRLVAVIMLIDPGDRDSGWRFAKRSHGYKWLGDRHYRSRQQIKREWTKWAHDYYYYTLLPAGKNRSGRFDFDKFCGILQADATERNEPPTPGMEKSHEAKLILPDQTNGLTDDSCSAPFKPQTRRTKMPHYKAKCKRGDSPGSYDVAYGRASKKLNAHIWNNDVAGGWCISEGSDGYEAIRDEQPFDKKKDIVSAWEAWAQEAYDGAAAKSASPSDGQPAPSRTTPPPPTRELPPPPKRELPPPPSRSKSEGVEDLPESERGKPEKVAEHAQKLHDGLASIMNWAWRNRKDLNSLPWRDGMTALAETNPGLYAKLKLATPK